MLGDRVAKEAEFRSAVNNIKTDLDDKLTTISQFVNLNKKWKWLVFLFNENSHYLIN